MNSRFWIFISFALIVFSHGSIAQTQSCPETTATCAIGNSNGYCASHLPATVHGCESTALFAEACWVKTDGCSPKAECNSCPAIKGGEPIDFATGNTYIAQTDLRLPGLGGGLTLERTWNSVWPDNEGAYRQGIFGTNWRSTYEERVFTGNDGYMKYSRGNGGFWSFEFSTTITDPHNYPVFAVNSPANEGTTLTEGETLWTLKFKNGEQRTFDRTSGYLLSIVDRNGNTTQLSYDPSSRLISVADPASRHLYFAYAAGTFMVTGVTSDFGVSLSYG